MDEETVSTACLVGYLTDRLKKRLGFYITSCTADLSNNDVCVRLFLHMIDKRLNFIGDMGNNLHRLPKIFAFSLFI